MQIYRVGGAVRDALLGRKASDTDFVVLGGNEAALSARISGLTRVGTRFFVYVRRGEEYSLSAAQDIAEDLLQRDLTINALAEDESGTLHAVAGGLEDVRQQILRPVRKENFHADPLRVLRAARFAALLPKFQVHPSLLGVMREVTWQEQELVTPERVTGELFKACAAERPGNFLRLLAQTESLAPWFPEYERAARIPAGPPTVHKGTVLEHTAEIMDACAGHATAVWLAFCHDLGKVETDPNLWPKHHGHEQRGQDMLKILALRLRLPAVSLRTGLLAARWHMQGACYSSLRPATRIRMLLDLARENLLEDFFRMVRADGGQDFFALAVQELACIHAVRLPEKHRNQGQHSAAVLLQLRVEALEAL